MKALTLWQPWAQAIVLGYKRVETRSWKPPDRLLGKRIAIHAAKADDAGLRAIAEEWPFRAMLYEAGITEFDEMQRGAILGTAVLAEFRPAEDVRRDLGARELALGAYDKGRWAWMLTDVERLDDPVPARGGQRLWNASRYLELVAQSPSRAPAPSLPER